MSLVGDAPNLVLDFEMYNPKVDSESKDEGELNVAQRLLSRVMEDMYIKQGRYHEIKV